MSTMFKGSQCMQCQHCIHCKPLRIVCKVCTASCIQCVQGMITPLYTIYNVYNGSLQDHVHTASTACNLYSAYIFLLNLFTHQLQNRVHARNAIDIFRIVLRDFAALWKSLHSSESRETQRYLYVCSETALPDIRGMQSVAKCHSHSVSVDISGPWN